MTPQKKMHDLVSLFSNILVSSSAHQVGNIKCENCYALLMYPYGAPAVRCSCCRFVTEIGVNAIFSITFVNPFLSRTCK